MSKNPSKAVDELYRHNNSHDGRKLAETDDFKMMDDRHLLTDKVLVKLSSELKNEWHRLALLLGLTGAQLKDIQARSSGVLVACFRALVAWRNRSEGSAEEKTRKLITSLREDNVGRVDLALMLENRLAELPETDDFEMMDDQRLLSDNVLDELSIELKNEWPRLALRLGLSSAQVNAIKSSISGVCMACFHALLAWRNRSEGSAEEKTRKLITSLREDNIGREDLAKKLEHRLAVRLISAHRQPPQLSLQVLKLTSANQAGILSEGLQPNTLAYTSSRSTFIQPKTGRNPQTARSAGPYARPIKEQFCKSRVKSSQILKNQCYENSMKNDYTDPNKDNPNWSSSKGFIIMADSQRESSPECSSDGSLVEEGKSSSTKNEKSLISVSNRSDHTDNTEITNPFSSMFFGVNQPDPINNAAVADRQNDEDENDVTHPDSVPAIMMARPKGTSATDDQQRVPPTGKSGPETNPEIKKAEYVAFGAMNVTKNYYPNRKYHSVANRSRTTNTVPQQVIPLSLHNPQTVVVKVRGQDGLKASALEIRNLVQGHARLNELDISEFYRYKDRGRWFMELRTAGLYERLHGLSFHAYSRKYSVDLEHLDKERHRVEFSWVPPNMSNDQLAELVMEHTKVECLNFIKVKESGDIRVTMIQRDNAEMLPDYINFAPSDGTIHTIAIKVYGRQTKRSNENDDAESVCESIYSTGTSNTESTETEQIL